MFKSLDNENSKTSKWLKLFNEDFKNRFLSLLSYDFSKFESGLVLNILNFQSNLTENINNLTFDELDFHFSKYDIKRIYSYSKNLIDYHVILDLVPLITRLYFKKKLSFHLSLTQASILISIGLQNKEISKIGLGLESNQILAQFNKIIKKFVTFINEVEKKRISNKNKNIYNEVKLINSDPNTTLEDLNKKDINEKKLIKQNKEEILFDQIKELDDIFEKPLDENNKEDDKEKNVDNSNKKKRKLNEIVSENDTNKKKNIAQELLKNEGKYKITVSNLDIDLNNNEKKIALSVSESIENKNKQDIKKHMFKDDKDLKKEKDEINKKIFKKGGGKRKIKE
jgi:N-acetyltransferase 10